jgi:hypothetical protein
VLLLLLTSVAEALVEVAQVEEVVVEVARVLLVLEVELFVPPELEEEEEVARVEVEVYTEEEEEEVVAWTIDVEEETSA